MVADVSEVNCVKYLDRFLMFYIATADKLTRTSKWLEKLEGGIEYLKKVVLEDAARHNLSEHSGLVAHIDRCTAIHWF